MSQINRRFASFFVVFAAIIVYQFSSVLAVAVLVIAVLLYQGFQMSDIRVNVPNRNQTQGLVSSLYSWTESAFSSVVQKCKGLTVSGGDSGRRSPTPKLSSPRRSGNINSDSENVGAYNRENNYKETFNQGHRVSDKFPKGSTSNTLVSVAEWNRKSPNTSSASFSKSLNSTSRLEPENDSMLPRGSPWGYSLSPQQRSTPVEVRSVQRMTSPLLASSRYNASRDSALYVDVNSPGFSSRLLKYHSEAAIHQPQYARPGQLPLVHLNTSPLPTINARNSQKVRAPVRVRIAPPTYDASESSLFSRPEKQPSPEHQTKSVIDALKEISRKRIHPEDDGNEAKRHHRSDSSSSSSSSSSPAMVNGVLTDQMPTGKRPREEDSPKQQKSTVKRTRNNEIYSSLSSSRNINIGTKRKAADSWSRCSTPTPIGKYLKKSPHQVSVPAKESGLIETSENQFNKQSESPQLAQQVSERKSQQPTLLRKPEIPSGSSRQPEVRPSSSHILEEYDDSLESLPKSQPGRLFVKAFSRGVPPKSDSSKGSQSKGVKPWKTQRGIDVDAITGEDIVEQELELGSRRLNSMFSVLQSNASSNSELAKGDATDGATSKADASKPSGNGPKGDAISIIQGEKSCSNPISLGESGFSVPSADASKTVLEKSDKDTPSNEGAQPTTLPSFGSIVNPLPNSVPNAEDSVAVVPPSQAPVSAPPATKSSDTALVSSPIGFTGIAPASTASLNPQPVSTISQVTSAETQSKDSTQTISSSGALGGFGNFNSGKPASSTFTVTQPADKAAISTNSGFTFGASGSTTAVASPLASSSSFGLSSSTASATPVVSSVSHPSLSSPFSAIAQATTVSTASDTAIAKSNAPTSTTGGFTFGATTSATPTSSSSVGGFSMPKTTASAIPFGMGSSSTPSFATTTAATSHPSEPSMTTANSAPAKPFAFGSSTSTTAVPASTAASQGGFSFQFGSGSQSNNDAPKPQETSGFKFAFGANKDEAPAAVPTAKPPTFGEPFAFGANPSNSNAQENKPMSFGTSNSMNPTLAAQAPAPSSGGFNFSADANASASAPKPTFGFGSSGSVGGMGTSAMGSSSGGFSFGAKPAETSTLAPPPSAPSMASPFQFGGNSGAMQGTSTIQQPQSQSVNSPFSIGGAEQKPQGIGSGFSFGSNPSASISPLQQNNQGFGQSSVPSFGSPSVNPLQGQQAVSPPSLFQFGSGGNSMPQQGMSSGGFNFGASTVPGATPSGFNFNPTGPSATTPFQFGANPMQPGMQAPAMFSIGSGSTAPRSRPRMRRLK